MPLLSSNTYATEYFFTDVTSHSIANTLFVIYHSDKVDQTSLHKKIRDEAEKCYIRAAGNFFT